MRHLHYLFMAVLVLIVSCSPKDEDLTKAIQSGISALSSDISVVTKEGVATLTGEVENAEIIQQAVALATGTKGIKSVVSNLTVREDWFWWSFIPTIQLPMDTIAMVNTGIHTIPMAMSGKFKNLTFL
ncbi:MAG: BON domain-containing protein [Cyclobacteriaceae bacterium]